ncbi:MAG: FAD-dependent oxidoreductase [candidate division WOR-3 bacterium]
MIYLLAYYISGYIYGEDGKPLEAATVILKRLPDSSNAGGTYSEKDGFFKIINVQPGRYVLIIKFVGYEDFSRVVEVSDRDVDLGRIVLKEKAIRVEEVEVKAEAPKITYEEGKRVIRFTDEIVSKGGNALEALKNVPGITVDNNDNIKIRNSENITLYINGRPTILSPSEALRQIPASSIEKIEIITNTNILEIKGVDFVTSVILDRKYKGSNELKLDGIFVAIGHVALSDLAKPLGVKINNKGEIMINHKTSETNIPGVYAAGDVTDKEFKQLITGVADGCTAAYYAYEYINKNE